jgi:tRNA dimethylallyltransferase
VYRVAGRTLTAIQQESSESGVQVEAVALLPGDRAALAADIERRFDRMVERGLVDEVRALRIRPGLDAESASMRAVGYRQVWAFLDGRWDWAEAARRAVTATRQLAKRQMTWLRGDPATVKLDARDPKLLQILKRRVAGYQDSA